jgi:hypothetical protein
VARIQVQNPYPANNGLDRTPFFFLFGFSFSFDAFDHEKKGVKQKQSGPIFFDLDVFFGVAVSFFLSSKLAIFFSYLSGRGSRSGLVPTYVVSQS